MPQSPSTQKRIGLGPKGQILRTLYHNDGHSTLVLDNGPARTVQILTRTEQLHELLGVKGSDLIEHITTRRPGHFRTKRNASQTV